MQPVNDSIEIGMYAACLADNFLKEFLYTSDKSYIAVLDEITAWAHEFYNSYYEKLKDWESFEQSEENIYNSALWEYFLIAWGKERLSKYLSK